MRSLLNKVSWLGMLFLGIALVVLSFGMPIRSHWQSLRLVLHWPSAALEQMLGLGTIAIVALGFVQPMLAQHAGAQLYARAVRTLGLVLTAGLLLWGTAVTGIALWVPADVLSAYRLDAGNEAAYVQAALGLVAVAMLAAMRHRPTEWHYWCLAWALALILVVGPALPGSALPGSALPGSALPGSALATAGIDILALGLSATIAADLWILREGGQRLPYRPSWHNIPLVYGTLGVLLGHAQLQPDSGLFTLVAAVIFTSVGRRQASLNAFSYVGLAALSMGAYELIIYRMLPAGLGGEGGWWGDRITLLAALAAVMALVEKVLSPWLLRYLQIAPMGLYWVAHTHWALGSLLVAIAPRYGLTFPHGLAIWTVAALLLAGYALDIGYRRWTPQTFAGHRRLWTALGFLQGLLCIVYSASHIL